MKKIYENCIKKYVEKYKYDVISFLVQVYPIIIMVVPTGLLINILSKIIDDGGKINKVIYISSYISNNFILYGVLFFSTLLLFINLIILLWYKYYYIFQPIRKQYENYKKNGNDITNIIKSDIAIQLSDLLVKYKSTCILINLLLIFIGINFILVLSLLYNPVEINRIQFFLLLFSSFFPMIVFYLIFNKIFKIILLLLGIAIIIVSMVLFVHVKQSVFYFLLFMFIPIFEYWLISTFQIKTTELEDKFSI
jgi:hypothetical protein